MKRTRNLFREVIVDNFAGGGGASTGISLAIGRDVDIAVNHDADAVLMHYANHPATRHYCEDVWNVDPVAAVEGQPVGLAWFSPDCKHFSKAKGGKPVNQKIRGLAWLAVKWAKRVKPRIIILENVEEFQTWGPVLADGKPCQKRKGQTFGAFVNALKRLGYAVAWRELRACDYGAPTTRKRLFLIARCDKKPITWPKPTHGKGLKPYRTAAECIDWSIPCPSIFERTRPLAPATLRRIAKGVMKYVVNCDQPFIVPVTHPRDSRVHSIDEPLRTVTNAPRGEFALAVPTLIQTSWGEREGQSPRVPGLEKPLGTVMGGGIKHALVAAFLAKHNGVGAKMVVGQDVRSPMHTITSVDQKAVVTAFFAQRNGDREGRIRAGRSATQPLSTVVGRGTQQAVVTSNLVKLRGGGNIGQPTDEPLRTISAGGNHFAEVRAFLIKYYGTDQDPQLREPLHTLTTKDRFGLVTVEGDEYAIVDIGMRMLTPRELFRAQGFPEDYIIGDDPAEGLILTKSAQVRMCGNSVCPPLAQALVQANYGDAIAKEIAA